MSVHNAAELEEAPQQAGPHLSVVPERPVLIPFDRDSLTEGAITRRIAKIVTDAKNGPKKAHEHTDETKEANASGDKAAKAPAPDYDTERSIKRQEIAVSIFRKFHMLDSAAVTDFTDTYSAAERGAIDPDTDTRRQLVNKVSTFIEHPVIRATMALTKEPGLYGGKDDGVIVQRTAALLLEGVEPANVWTSDLA